MRYGDRIQVISSSTGAGTLTISGTALESYFPFADAKGSGLFPVTIIHSVAANDEAEVSLCSLSGTTLTREKCVQSTNANAFVNFSAGTKYVFINLSSVINFPGLNQLKARCVASEFTTNRALSILVPAYSLNGVALAANDRVFLNAQTDPKENGPWVIQSSGDPQRPLDFYTGDVAEAIVPVGNLLFVCTTPTAVIGTNNLTFSPSGNVIGPASSTDNALVRWDSTTGKLVKDSNIIVNNDGKVSGKASASASNVISTSGTVNLDLGLYNHFDVTASGGNVTLTVSNAVLNQVVFLRFRQEGSRTLTFFGNISWDNNAPPTITTTADRWDNFCFICRNAAGPNWDGFILGQNHQ